MNDFSENHIGFLLGLPFGSLHDGHEAAIDGVSEGGDARRTRYRATREQERKRMERGLLFFRHMRGHTSKMVIAKAIEGGEKPCHNGQGVPARVRQ